MNALAKLTGKALQRFDPCSRKRNSRAPAPCKARAIASPMPPDAPVTNADFPDRSNINMILLEAAEEGFDIVRSLN